MNLLITSLAFAPFSGVGAARMTSLAEYLINHGHNVTVVSYDSKVFDEKQQKRKIPKGIHSITFQKCKEKKKNQRKIYEIIEDCMNETIFDLWIISVGPFEIMDVIYKLYRKKKVPYIIDYRDIWLFEKNHQKFSLKIEIKQQVYNFLHLPVEWKVMKNARKIVFVTEYCRRDIKKRYCLDNTKCEVILNGYEDLPRLKSKFKVDWDHISLGIAGKFGSYDVTAARDCLNACRECDEFTASVYHVGIREEKFITEFGEPVYYGLGTMDHRETMELLAKLDVLVIVYQHSVGLGTKVYDYIALNKPIIYVGLVPSELSCFISQFENMFLCRDKQGVLDALKVIHDNRVIKLTEKDILRFSREFRNKEYINLIENI